MGLVAVNEKVCVTSAEFGNEVEGLGEVASGGDARDVDPEVSQDVTWHAVVSDFLADEMHEIFGVDLSGVDLPVREYDDAVPVQESAEIKPTIIRSVDNFFLQLSQNKGIKDYIRIQGM